MFELSYWGVIRHHINAFIDTAWAGYFNHSVWLRIQMSLRIFGQYDLLYEMCRSYIFYITWGQLFFDKQYIYIRYKKNILSYLSMRIHNIIVHEIMDNCWKGLSEKFLSIDVILNLLYNDILKVCIKFTIHISIVKYT